jgi:hypothetical protein
MATAVKLFAHRGIVALPVLTRSQDTKDTVFVLEQPYLATEALTAAASAVASAPATCPGNTGLLRIEVEDGKTIRYELNPPGRSVAATANSPALSGRDVLMAGGGWSISVIEA